MKNVSKQSVSYSRLMRFDEYVNSDIFNLDVVSMRTVSFERNNVYNNKPHKHSFYELHYSLGGTMRFDFDDKNSVSVQKGHFIIIPPKKLHMVDTSKRFSKLVFGFDISLNPESAGYKTYSHIIDGLSKPSVSKGLPFMEALIERLFDKNLKNSAGCKQEIAYLVKALLIEAFDKTQHNKKAERMSEVFHQDERITDSINFIKDNIGLGITREEVADNVYLSVKQIDRLFIKEKGVTLRHYMDEVKIQKISSYLIETDMPLSKIAERTGFSSEYSMSRFFSANVGVSPAKYRGRK